MIFLPSRFLLLGFLPLLFLNVWAQEEPVRRLQSGRHLFLDDSLTDAERTTGISRIMTPPNQLERVLKPERPWEALGFIFYSSVVDHHGTAMLYYGCYDANKGKHLALATSQDGKNWLRPNLQLTPFQGSKQNNLFPMEAVEAGIFLDPAAPLERRFRLLHNRFWPSPEQAGVYLSSSPDGIHWQLHPTRLLPRIPDSQPSAFWDERLKRYTIYLRAWNPKRAIARLEVTDLEAAWPFESKGPSRHAWGPDKVATISNELPIVMQTDSLDPTNLHLYTSTVVKYPWANQTYLSFPAAYFHFTGPTLRPRALDGNDGTFDIQMATSRDGIHWNRYREPWIAPGHLDGLTLQLVSMGTGMIRRGRELHQYFVGWPHTHNRPVQWDRDLEDRKASLEKDLGGIYRATFRVDGFVALHAGHSPGTWTSLPLQIQGNRLFFNMANSGTGWATIALLAPDGTPLPGYQHEDCEVLHADSIKLPVTWRGHGHSIPYQSPLRIQIRMSNTHVWAVEATLDS